MEKYTLITGACGGLGRAFVKQIADQKNNLVLVGTSQKKLDLLSDDFKDEFKDIKTKCIVCDLSKSTDRENLLNSLQENKIVVNKLINNAGLIIEGDLLRFGDDEILKAIQINCEGTLDLTQKLIKIRDESEKFEVLTVSSVASFYPIPHMAVYSATKAFVTSMMTSLAIELKDKNVVFTTVNPGGMATTDAMKESIKSMGLGGKLSTLPVEKVAKIALKALKKKKTNVVPGFTNKLLVFFSKILPKRLIAKSAGKLYAKSQKKRGF